TAAPEMNEARSLSRKVVSSATSAGRPSRPSGIEAASSDSAMPPSSSFCCSMGVRISPGQIEFARTPWAPKSLARLRVSETTAAFELLYAMCPPAGCSPPLRGDIDDGGRTGLLEEGQRRPTQAHDCVDVDGVGRRAVVLVDLEQIAATHHPGAVDEPVDGAEAVGHLGEEIGAPGGFGQIREEGRDRLGGDALTGRCHRFDAVDGGHPRTLPGAGRGD